MLTILPMQELFRTRVLWPIEENLQIESIHYDILALAIFDKCTWNLIFFHLNIQGRNIAPAIFLYFLQNIPYPNKFNFWKTSKAASCETYFHQFLLLPSLPTSSSTPSSEMKNLEMSKDYINPHKNMLLTYLPGSFYIID